MTHHRGLVITLVVAVVVAVVGIGVMELTTNDTDESVQEEVSSPFLNSRHVGSGSSPRFSNDVGLNVVNENQWALDFQPLYPESANIEHNASNFRTIARVIELRASSTSDSPTVTWFVKVADYFGDRGALVISVKSDITSTLLQTSGTSVVTCPRHTPRATAGCSIPPNPQQDPVGTVGIVDAP